MCTRLGPVAVVAAKAFVMMMAFVVVMACAGCGAPAVERVGTERATNARTTTTSATMSVEQTNRLDGAIERVIADSAIPGAIVGIWAPDGEYVRAFGVADTKTRAPMKPDLYSRIGSQTKTFTVTAALLLADQGKVGLDNPIARYVDGVPRGAEITLRQLARMQSGLPNYTQNPAFVRQLLDDPRREFTPAQLLGFAYAQPASFGPGGGFEYSNTNTLLLGLVVEKVSSQSLGDYVRDHITGPLHMDDTGFPSDNAFPKPHATGYTKQTLDGGETTATDWNPSWAWASGAMISTLHDMRIWAPALATGPMLTGQMQQERLQFVDRDGEPAPNGYGLGVFSANGWIGHNGSLPGYQTVSVYLPDRQTAVVIFVNTDIPFDGADPGTLLAAAVTKELTPEHVYQLG
ncbi:serine hydrolase domain-containing protein [Mycobacterium sp. 236(2023)]|uniref:serine hydrolase domain-containing protein n=1 Tax=Mycobacterium sp. 236(2023) TaxID=3038163 RepID=UPI002414F6E7|nr:serine hydrolase domain-containing protein [Mycobacterium sp. 236(2023)]MDG4666814.1 serine hydrolase [Mycobacterium sp. 236(2023)]